MERELSKIETIRRKYFKIDTNKRIKMFVNTGTIKMNIWTFLLDIL